MAGFNKVFKGGAGGLRAGANNATKAFESSEKKTGGGGNYYANSVPLAYWTMEDGSGDTVTDQSSAGNNLNGTKRTTGASGRPTWDSSTKVRGTYSLNFDGVSATSGDHVTVPDNNLLDFSTDDPFTISAWIKRAGNGTGQVGHGIVTKAAQASSTDSPFEGYALWFGGSGDTQQRRVSFYLYRNISGIQQLRVQSTNLVFATTDTDWHNIVATYDGSSNLSGVKIYVDGSSIDIELEASDTLSPGMDITTSTSLSIGSFINNAQANTIFYPFDGNMDEVAIWTKSLSAAEVAASYNSGAGVDLTNGIPDDD